MLPKKMFDICFGLMFFVLLNTYADRKIFITSYIYDAFKSSIFVPDTYSVIISFILMKHRGLIP